jgi:hypothetical protein
MHIYKVDRIGHTDYDEYDGFIVAAQTARQARQFAAVQAGHYERAVWTSPRDATIRKIGSAADGVEAGVILGSFKAG